jgi:beta-xylosidase
VFAPAGGVEHGWQAVFRSRTIDGPYEVRTVMDQGNTQINGPHQGAWVRAQDGRDWFLHFQDKGAHGRVVHLQPMLWRDDWPLIGEPGPRAGTGQPVPAHAKPLDGSPVRVPATSDEFDSARLGLQWQWNANPGAHWYSLTERPGRLRLHTQPLASAAMADAGVRGAPSILAQKLPAPSFVVDTHIELAGAREGDRAGLILNGMQYAWLGLRKLGGATELVYTTCTPAPGPCKENPTVVLPAAPASLYLRMTMAPGAVASFAYSLDNRRFVPVGAPFTASKGRWVGAQIGLFSVGTNPGPAASNLDVDYFRASAR